ncbi:MAG TPA: hypothetical protein VN711_00910 [Candidatus Saccharimonadales bacterium]|nr:hypothetical protein [Candidatus Saccharimonadales bacterium]
MTGKPDSSRSKPGSAEFGAIGQDVLKPWGERYNRRKSGLSRWVEFIARLKRGSLRSRTIAAAERARVGDMSAGQDVSPQSTQSPRRP